MTGQRIEPVGPSTDYGLLVLSGTFGGIGLTAAGIGSWLIAGLCVGMAVLVGWAGWS